MSIKRAVDGWLAEGKSVAVACVVQARESSPREPGSLMAVSSAGDVAGSVSAGCVEGAVVAQCLDCIEEGEPCVMSFKDGADAEWDVTLPCGGEVQILVQPYDDEVHELLLRLMEEGAPYTYLAVAEPGHPLLGAQAAIGEDEQAFSWMDDLVLEEVQEVFASLDAKAAAAEPHPARRRALSDVTATASIMGATTLLVRRAERPTLVCVGAVHIAQALVPMARALGYRTVVVDPRAAFATPDRFPEADAIITAWPQEALAQVPLTGRTAVCALTHDAKIDVPTLAAALESDAFYLGCLGSFKTLGDRRAALMEEGFDTSDLERVWGPIGLYIGGNTPEEIALSIMAQIQAVRYGRSAFGEAMPGHTLAFDPSSGGDQPCA